MKQSRKLQSPETPQRDHVDCLLLSRSPMCLSHSFRNAVSDERPDNPSYFRRATSLSFFQVRPLYNLPMFLRHSSMMPDRRVEHYPRKVEAVSRDKAVSASLFSMY